MFVAFSHLHHLPWCLHLPLQYRRRYHNPRRRHQSPWCVADFPQGSSADLILSATRAMGFSHTTGRAWFSWMCRTWLCARARNRQMLEAETMSRELEWHGEEDGMY